MSSVEHLGGPAGNAHPSLAQLDYTRETEALLLGFHFSSDVHQGAAAAQFCILYRAFYNRLCLKAASLWNSASLSSGHCGETAEG